ncbi:unnamed protein product [Moneuplotes crassus]|uniref:Uncharacterized protein n=1 Tax=Euplotes crassus TaxID=5936 RepID=A0AAD1XLB3_EUPCR|nr:unnamed protein product [Moneuplotes crassus]
MRLLKDFRGYRSILEGIVGFFFNSDSLKRDLWILFHNGFKILMRIICCNFKLILQIQQSPASFKNNPSSHPKHYKFLISKATFSSLKIPSLSNNFSWAYTVPLFTLNNDFQKPVLEPSTVQLEEGTNNQDEFMKRIVGTPKAPEEAPPSGEADPKTVALDALKKKSPIEYFWEHQKQAQADKETAKEKEGKHKKKKKGAKASSKTTSAPVGLKPKTPKEEEKKEPKATPYVIPVAEEKPAKKKKKAKKTGVKMDKAKTEAPKSARTVKMPTYDDQIYKKEAKEKKPVDSEESKKQTKGKKKKGTKAPINIGSTRIV